MEAGIEHTYAGDYPYVVGGGVAAFDCDDDGRTDLYLAGGEGNAALYRNRSEIGGSLRFEQVADPSTDLASVTGAYPVDIDGDGHIDLAVLRLGEDVILRGLGDCRFERANESLAFDGGSGWTVGFSATWESPAAALPTLAFGDYLDARRPGRADERMRGRPARPTCGIGHDVRRARRADAELVHALDALQRLGPVGPARSAGVQRPPLLPGRRGTAVADRGRPGRRGSTRATRAGPCCGSGAWASPARTSPATRTRRST